LSGEQPQAQEALGGLVDMRGICSRAKTAGDGKKPLEM
jgi:hypothetical protein